MWGSSCPSWVEAAACFPAPSQDMQRALTASARLFLNEPPWKASSSISFWLCLLLYLGLLDVNQLLDLLWTPELLKGKECFRCTCSGSPAGGALLFLWAAPGSCGGEDTSLCLSSILHMASRQGSCHSPPHPGLGTICTCISAQISFNTAASTPAAHKVRCLSWRV